MDETPKTPRPGAIIAQRPAPKGVSKPPRGVMGKVQARERPGMLPVPVNRNVSALTRPSVFDRWVQDAAGVRAVSTGDNVITMFDVIGDDPWSGGGITAKGVTAQLRAIGNRPVEVQINSPGGDMFEGISIYNALRDHAQPITVKIMGMAASAASIIAMAGDEVQIGTASFVMIHNCSVLAMGNRHDMLETAAYLAPFDAAMADVYAARTGEDAKTIASLMDAETFMSGTQAIERGFADSLLPADQLKTDDSAKASDRHANELRAMERTLLQAGHTREEARARVDAIRGKRDAAPDPATLRDAGGTELLGDLTGLLASIRS